MNKLLKTLIPIIIAFTAFAFNLFADDGINTDVALGQVKIHFLDVGQADSILIQDASGQTMLIDAGNNGDSDLVVSYIRDLGIDHIDVLIGTHPHEDHIGGLDAVIENFDIGKIYMPKINHSSKTYEDVLIAIKNKGYKINTPQAGSTFDLGNAEYTILSPISKTYSDTNNYSITVKLDYGEHSFLFMGDAEKIVENEIIEMGYPIQADLIKLGHHGSMYSSSDEFLDKVNPKYAIISVGEGNSYGHPDPEIMTKLEERGIKSYRTDEMGTIVVESDGSEVRFAHLRTIEN
ncbi:beta-lactamase superfamily II metal-dependent hydrolase [Alkalibaculum bacchi]|uniref:Beta-lactamase superfamily II metal-dependent hydrolase n=1 Tax=Alkalibaculum bacchi TaxID=645887 RepID=A0A366HX95_9FIRM|nr:ComEC/Rec2 family competence protein [Alkalibaculum bacchi]RBP58208.1 beta-lactamase superfamily II metal-dependent hydrolase [Alkalibaculum bacchi]